MHAHASPEARLHLAALQGALHDCGSFPSKLRFEEKENRNTPRMLTISMSSGCRGRCLVTRTLVWLSTPRSWCMASIVLEFKAAALCSIPPVRWRSAVELRRRLAAAAAAGRRADACVLGTLQVAVG